MVNVEFVVIVQSSAAPAMVQDAAPLNDAEATKFLDVNISNLDPALVVKEGVTVKEIKLSPVCIAVNLLV